MKKSSLNRSHYNYLWDGWACWLPHIFSNRGIKLEIFLSTLIFLRYLDFAENPANSPTIRFTISAASLQISIWNEMSNIDCRISTSANWDKIVKNYNSLRLPWKETMAPKGAAAHSLGTTGLCNIYQVKETIHHLLLECYKEDISKSLRNKCQLYNDDFSIKTNFVCKLISKRSA